MKRTEIKLFGMYKTFIIMKMHVGIGLYYHKIKLRRIAEKKLEANSEFKTKAQH
jgi:hypothetical protein